MTDFCFYLRYTYFHKRNFLLGKEEGEDNVTIYLDAVWLLNFFLDWMILMLTHSLSKSQNNRWRLILGAGVASLLVPINIYFPASLWSSPLGKGIFSIIIIFTAFGFRNLRIFVRHILYFYFISFAIGGGLFGIYFVLNEHIQVSNGVIVTYQTGFGDGVSWLFVFIGFPIVWWFTKKRMDQLVVQQMKYDEMVQVKVSIMGETQETTALIDSGNQLTDPITKRPVIICDESLMKGWFSEEDWKLMKQVSEELSLDQLPDRWSDQVRIIPYQGVSGQSAFMMAIKPDWIEVTTQGRQVNVNQVLVGVQFGQLAPDDSYHCLMHPHLLKTIAVESA